MRITRKCAWVIKAAAFGLTLASLGFVAYVLSGLNYGLLATGSFDHGRIAISIGLLVAAEVVHAMAWAAALRVHRLEFRFRKAASAHWLSVFAKYIPGRIWSILGRAGRIAAFGVPLGRASIISLEVQLLSIWLGLCGCGAPFFFLLGHMALGLVAIGLLLLGIVVLFSRRLRAVAFRLASRLLRREFEDTQLRGRDTWSVIARLVAMWALYCGAFALLIQAVQPASSLLGALVLPLAMNAGVVTLVLPAGIGAREAVMSRLLLMVGIAQDDAVAIAIAARLWMIASEALVFLLGVLCRPRKPSARVANSQDPREVRPRSRSNPRGS